MLNKADLELLKKTGGRVTYTPNGHRYEGQIQVLDWTGNRRRWFIADIVDGKTICVPLVDLNLREKQKIEHEKQMAEATCRLVIGVAENAKPGMLKEEDKRFIAYTKNHYLYLNNVVLKKAPLRFFSRT